MLSYELHPRAATLNAGLFGVPTLVPIFRSSTKPLAHRQCEAKMIYGQVLHLLGP